MDRFRAELKQARHFEAKYYKELLDTIDTYVSEKPDITIETCKSIIEGLSKLILMELEQTPEGDFRKPDLNLAKLFKDARSALKKHIDKPRFEIVYEDTIVEPYGNIPNILEQLLNPEVVARIGILRTDHGDISHGRTPLKEQVNDEALAELIIGLTDSICSYMLRKFHEVKEDVLLYEDNPDFNEYLDELYPLSGKVLYSKALFDQEFETYGEELEDYRIRQEEENAEKVANA